MTALTSIVSLFVVRFIDLWLCWETWAAANVEEEYNGDEGGFVAIYCGNCLPWMLVVNGVKEK